MTFATLKPLLVSGGKHMLDIGSILGGAVVVSNYIAPIGGALLVIFGIVSYAIRAFFWLKARLGKKAG